MARTTVVRVNCDGCGNEFEEGSAGTSQATLTVVGAEKQRRIDFCGDCTGKMPAGTEVAKRGRKPKSEESGEKGSEEPQEAAGAEESSESESSNPVDPATAEEPPADPAPEPAPKPAAKGTAKK